MGVIPIIQDKNNFSSCANSNKPFKSKSTLNNNSSRYLSRCTKISPFSVSRRFKKNLSPNREKRDFPRAQVLFNGGCSITVSTCGCGQLDSRQIPQRGSSTLPFRPRCYLTNVKYLGSYIH
jgi:hypothetical protein